MSAFRITHIDAVRCRRVLRVWALCRDDAVAQALQAYGEAWVFAVIRT